MNIPSIFWIVPAASVVALSFAWAFYRLMKRVDEGPPRLREIAAHVRKGAMAYLRQSGQDEAILSAIGRGVPFLGICLGLQLLFERGDERCDGALHGPDDPERWAAGLGVLPGSVSRLRGRLKVPHVGWNQVHLTPHGRVCPLLRGVPEGANAYFTHSYALDEDVDPLVVTCRTHYVRSFASAVWRDNVYGVQFHPEKSSAVGLTILRNYVDLVRGGGR